LESIENKDVKVPPTTIVFNLCGKLRLFWEVREELGEEEDEDLGDEMDNLENWMVGE